MNVDNFLNLLNMVDQIYEDYDPRVQNGKTCGYQDLTKFISNFT